MKFDLSKDIQVKQFDERCKFLKGKGAKVTITQNIKRTTSQNAYLHVLISLYACHFGWTKDEAKTLLKRMCGFMVYEKKGVKLLRPTSGLSIEEMISFITWIRNHSSQEGCYLPTGKEYRQEQFYYDQMIEQHRQYL